MRDTAPSGSEALSFLLLDIYRASRDLGLDAFQDAALEILKARIPFDSCTWGAGAVQPSGLVVHSAHLHRELPSRYLAYDEIKDQDTVAFQVVRQSPRSLNVHIPTLYAEKEKSGIREFAVRIRHQNELIRAQVVPGSQDVTWVALFRARADDQFSESQRRLSELVFPHLQQALVDNRQRNADALLSPSNKRYSVAFCDYTGSVLYMASSFLALLIKEWPEARANRLPYPLVDAFSQAGARGFRGRSLVAAFSQLNGVVIVLLREKLPADSLTDREHTVARAIALGSTHKEIARTLGLSPATVRNYTQRIHDRLRVRNNVELALEMRSYAEMIEATSRLPVTSLARI